jgi:hypothetical protein
MIKRVLAGSGARKIILMDSISHVDAADAGHIVVSASHGGASSGEYAIRHKLAAVFFNDAGVGKDGAGIAALGMLERAQVAAGTVSHLSARIGDVEDMWEHGVLSHLNALALGSGLREGDRLRDAVGRLLSYGACSSARVVKSP